MAHFFLLLLVSGILKTSGEIPNLSQIDRLLNERYNTRNHRELNFDPGNYPEDMRLNEVESDSEGDSPGMKNRRHDDDYVQMRESKPVPYAKSSHNTDDGKKMMPIPHSFPILVPLIISQSYPVPVFPLNFSTMQRSHPREKVHHHDHHDHVSMDHDHEHWSEGHGHEHSMGGHDHEHQTEGHGH